MRLLCFSDMHGSTDAFKKIKEKALVARPVLIICAGDMTVFEQNMTGIIKLLNSLPTPVLITHGNHEEEDSLREMCEIFPNVEYLHRESYVHEDVLFLFFGGGGFSLRDEEFEKVAPLFEEEMKEYEKVVLVTHPPPYDTEIDKIVGESCGCKSFKNFIKKHKDKLVLHVSGHLHENAGKEDQIGKCKIINAGPYGTIVDI